MKALPPPEAHSLRQGRGDRLAKQSGAMGKARRLGALRGGTWPTWGIEGGLLEEVTIKLRWKECVG